MRKLLSFEDGCARLGYHPQHARKLIKAGKIKPPIHLYAGGRPMFVEEDIEDLISDRQAERDAQSKEAA